MKNLKEPKHLKICRIVGFLLLVTGVVLIVLGCAVFRKVWSWNGDTMINPALVFPGAFICAIGLMLLFMGFSAKISKMSVESERYVQEIAKDDLKSIANTSVDIVSEPITKVVKTVKNSIKNTKFCKHCGGEIDSDSQFCKHCGKEQ